MKTQPKIGLRQRIQLAKSQDEIKQLLQEGESYEHAQPKLRKAWLNASIKRALELTQKEES